MSIPQDEELDFLRKRVRVLEEELETVTAARDGAHGILAALRDKASVVVDQPDGEMHHG